MDSKTAAILLTALEGDETLTHESSLGRRNGVIHLLSYLDGQLRRDPRDSLLGEVDARLDDFKRRLAAVNSALFERLRSQIREGRATPASLRLEFNRYTAYEPGVATSIRTGSDDLDDLLNGLLELHTHYFLSEPPPPNMVPYSPTPARVVLEAADSAGLRDDDVFYDLGSGLGRVVILANLISGAKAVGVEINPLLHEQACGYGNRLALPGASFINADVRDVDYADGTVFFMYTPFTGEIMETVLAKLESLARQRPIRVCAYGPCTVSVAQQSWLSTDASDAYTPFSPVVFRSRAA